jgi:uncharacterized cupin superfamily protein
VSAPVNLLDDAWDGEWDRPGYRRRQARLGPRLGAELLGASLYELPAGESVCPYHFHLGLEEWLIVVAGRPTLRTREGERELERGEAVCFLDGERGAHQVLNRTDKLARVLLVSTMQDPYVSYYPDSDKVGIRTSGERPNFRRADAIDYWEDEPDEPLSGTRSPR